MNSSLSGVFFPSPMSALVIIEFLKGKYQVETYGYLTTLLEGVCDSRNGGRNKFVFSTLESFLKNSLMSESFILIDEMPDEADQASNLFCKVDDPKAAFIDVLNWLKSTVGINAHRCRFNEEACISKDAFIDSSAIIQAGVEIGAGSVISAGAVIKTGTRIGENTVIRENAVIGSDGITVYRTTSDRLVKFPHVGGVFVGDNTEVGSNAVVAGGILEATYIGNNVIIGNLCNVGHGANIHDNVWMSVGSLVGGHTVIYRKATIAMGVTIRDNLVIGPEASVGMGSVVVKNVEARHSMFGNPAKRMINLKTGPKR